MTSTLLISTPYHVRLGHNLSFEPSWTTCAEACYPLFSWFLDFTTHRCTSSEIYQNLALQVSSLSSSEQTLNLTSSRWFHAHWPIQFLIAGPVIFAGCALGHQTTSLTGDLHYGDPHQKIGLSLLILYVLQLFIGAFVHFFKFPTIFNGYRPPHSYFHVFVGLSIIILAQYQVCAAPK